VHGLETAVVDLLTSGTIIVAIGPDGRLRAVNPPACALLGRSGTVPGFVGAGAVALLFAPARRAVEQRLRHGDGVGLVAEPDGMLEGELAFVEVLLAGGRLSVRRARRGGAASVQKVVDLVPLPLAGLGILVGLGHVARLLPVASAVVSCREQSWLMLARLSGSDWQSPFHVRRSPPARGAPDGGSLPGRPGCATVLLGRQSRAVRNGMNPRGRTHLRRRRDALPGSSRLNGSRDMYLYLM